MLPSLGIRPSRCASLACCCLWFCALCVAGCGVAECGRVISPTTNLPAPLPPTSHPTHSNQRPATQHLNHLSQVTEEDYELLAEYIDAIRHLTAAAQLERPDKEEVQRLSRMVLHMQEVGARLPSFLLPAPFFCFLLPCVLGAGCPF